MFHFVFQSHKHQVNYRDPALGRTALHWSCTGGHVEASRLLLQHNADVNCCDRDTVTPVLRAALSGCTELLKLLVQAGAQVLHRDRLNATALHYASFHGRHHQVELLIKSGCVQNNHTVFGHGTPLANIIYHRDFSNAVLLVEAGYNLSNDKWVLSVQDLPRGPLSITRRRREADNDREDEWSEEDVLKLLKHEASNPRCLLRSCRTAIRACMGGVHVQAKLNKIPLPSTMIRYLSLN